MKKYDKEIAQAQLDNEKAVLKKLEGNYADALEEINSKIAELMGRADADMQHVIYQVEYQKSLKKQVETILETLHSNEFETVSEYLTKCYDEGFLGTLYSLQSQGVPLAIPINQEEIVAAIQNETKLSTSLYEAFDMKDLQKKIASEITRGFSTGAMYSEIARNISAYTNVSKNKAMRIARTEGHRITEAAAYNAQLKAKDRGADIVKIWDAALDAKTRPSHVKVDGEIRELEKKFSNGLMYPGDPNGSAAEVVNCRCRSRSDARWALESDQTKMLGKVSEMSDKQKKAIADKLGISVEDLEQYSDQIVPINAKNYSDFKKQYDRLWHYEGSNLQAEAEARIAGYGKKSTVQKSTVNPIKDLENDTTFADLKATISNMGIDEDTQEALTSYISKLPPKEREAWEKAFAQARYDIDEIYYGDERFDPKTGTIGISKYSQPRTIIHETAHSIDKGAVDFYQIPGKEWSRIDSASVYVETLINSEANYKQHEHFAKFFGYDSIEDYEKAIAGGDLASKYSAWADKIIKETNDETGFNVVSDIISGFTNDAIGAAGVYGGHYTSYWERATPPGYASTYQVEAWANYCTLKAMGNSGMIDVLNSVLPQEAEALEKVYREVFG